MLGSVLGVIGFARVAVWQQFTNIYGEHWIFIGLTVGGEGGGGTNIFSSKYDFNLSFNVRNLFGASKSSNFLSFKPFHQPQPVTQSNAVLIISDLVIFNSFCLRKSFNG